MMRDLRERAGLWLRQPVESAASNLGLFRIVYSAFYLWHLSHVRVGLLASAPSQNWRPIYLFGTVLGRPPVWLAGIAEAVLAGLLVLLLTGLQTRTVTVLVFVVGFFIDGTIQSLGKVEHGTVFLTFYLPLILSFSTWGETYSLDALRRRDSHRTNSLHDDSDWRHAWPMKLVLLILSFLYLTAGLSKWLGGHWLSDPDIISNLLARAYYRSIVEGIAPNPLTDVILQIPALDLALRACVPLFECLFAAVLLGPLVRRFYISLAVLFHAANAALLAVTFTPVLIAYGVAVNWKGLLVRVQRRTPFKAGIPNVIPSWLVLAASSAALAVAVAADWNVAGVARQVASFGGVLNWLTIWYVAAPLAAVCLVRTAARLVKSQSLFLSKRNHPVR